MLRTSKLTDYGTVVMAHLARQALRVQRATEVAAELHLALPTVTKVLKTLTRDGLLVSTRGSQGGYRLSRAPEEISVAQIISAMEGPIALTECTGTPGMCLVESRCSIRGHWQVINRAVLDALEEVSVADLVRPANVQRVAVGSLHDAQQARHV